MLDGNLIFLSTASINALTGKPYFDIYSTLKLMQRVHRGGLVDGFEFQNLAEWDARYKIRTNPEQRLEVWHTCPKHNIEDIDLELKKSSLPILSIHANRDIGAYLCSDQEHDNSRGLQLIRESLYLADQVNASVCVFHLWDTRSAFFNIDSIKQAITEASADYPNVKLAVENVPTHLPGKTPFALSSEFQWVTLDLKWAAIYDELEEFKFIKEKIANIHLRGSLVGGRWELPNAPFHFYDALNTIRDEWHYSGLITMEADNLGRSRYEDFELGLSSLKSSDKKA